MRHPLFPQQGWGPLHFAAKSGYLASVQLLVESGAAPTLESKEGKTAVQYAAAEHHQDVMSFLLRKSNNTLKLLEDRKVRAMLSSRLVSAPGFTPDLYLLNMNCALLCCALPMQCHATDPNNLGIYGPLFVLSMGCLLREAVESPSSLVSRRDRTGWSQEETVLWAGQSRMGWE